MLQIQLQSIVALSEEFVSQLISCVTTSFIKSLLHLRLKASGLCWRQIPAAHQAEGRHAARLSNSLIQLGDLH